MKELKRKKNRGRDSSKPSGSLKCRKSAGRSPATQDGDANREGTRTVGNAARLLVGLALSCYLGWLFARHTRQLHENELWFSHITQLQREISFRTESGLYYSYYKQLVEAPSLLQGFVDLCHDNITESGRVVNIIQRFNIFPEVVIAAVYRLLPFGEPVYFYIDSVLLLNAGYVVAMFCTAWFLSGSLMGGTLACTFFIFNREDATRLEFALPLRESFAFPFIAIQILCISLYLSTSLYNKTGRWACVTGMLLSSLGAALVWQFTQFVFLLEGSVLLILHFGSDIFTVGKGELIPRRKVLILFWCHAAALLLTSFLQFFNTMLLVSLSLSFTLSASLVMLAITVGDRLINIHWPAGSSSFVVKGLSAVVALAMTFALMVIISSAVRIMLGVNSDGHIFQFLLAKLGFNSLNTRNFDTLLYLCEPAFHTLPLHTLTRLTSTLLFPAYLITMSTILVSLAAYCWRSVFTNDADAVGGALQSLIPTFKKTDVPANVVPTPPTSPPLSSTLIFNAFLNISFFVVALTTRRFKHLWVPHMCVLVGAGVAHEGAWQAALKRLGLRERMRKFVYLLGVPTIIAAIVIKELPRVWDQLTVLKEFYDPDTVELMKWIISSTPQTAVFAASMQLLAGVKLCTGRAITNHPHFEDKVLRERTKQVYQMYTRISPAVLHFLLFSFKTDYIIVEDGLCYAKSSPSNANCGLTDIMDTVSGQQLDSGNPGLYSQNLQSVEGSKEFRFCAGLRTGGDEYTRYYSLVFFNRTFRVYKLLYTFEARPDI